MPLPVKYSPFPNACVVVYFRMDVSFSQAENYLAESPARFSEETVQSLYADEQPKKRIIHNMEQSKLADTLVIENTIMLNPEDLAKVSARNVSDDFNKNFGVPARQTGKFSSRQRAGHRQAYDPAEATDLIATTSLPETRTSVIRGIMSTRQMRNMQDSESETVMDSTEYNKLHCFEQVDKDNGENFQHNRHYLHNSVMETYTTQSDNATHVSEKFDRPPVSNKRTFQMSNSMETRPTSQPYYTQMIRGAAYRVQEPPEFEPSKIDSRGKQYFERPRLVPSSGMSYGALNSKYNMPDRVFLQNHVEMQGSYPGFTMYEGRSSASGENKAKNYNNNNNNNIVQEIGKINHLIHSISFNCYALYEPNLIYLMYFAKYCFARVLAAFEN